MKDTLYKMNPWWEDGVVPGKRLGINRPAYSSKLISQVGKKHVSVIAGPRRCGKTTLLFQVIQSLIESGVQPRTILYAQLDHTSIPPDRPLDRVLETFRTENSIPGDEKVHLFLDEIQYIPDWARWVKGVYDLENAKIFVSGSSASILLPSAMSRLAGRQITTRVHPLSFGEYIEFMDMKPKKRDAHLHSGLYRRYLETGGFPEAVLEDDESSRLVLLHNYLQDMMFKDIVQVHAIRDIGTLKALVLYIMSGTGQPLSLNKASKVLQVSINTVREMVGYLESAFLIGSIEMFSASRNARIYNPRKYYPIDTGLRTAALGKFDEGLCSETVVHNHLVMSGADLFYWRSKREVDFIVPGMRLALESKFTDDVEERDAEALAEFAGAHRGFTCRLLTRGTKGDMTVDGCVIGVIPTWEFLLSAER